MSDLVLVWIAAAVMVLACVVTVREERRHKRELDRLFGELDGHLKMISDDIQNDAADAFERGIIRGIEYSKGMLNDEQVEREARYFGKQ